MLLLRLQRSPLLSSCPTKQCVNVHKATFGDFRRLPATFGDCPRHRPLRPHAPCSLPSPTTSSVRSSSKQVAPPPCSSPPLSSPPPPPRRPLHPRCSRSIARLLPPTPPQTLPLRRTSRSLLSSSNLVLPPAVVATTARAPATRPPARHPTPWPPARRLARCPARLPGRRPLQRVLASAMARTASAVASAPVATAPPPIVLVTAPLLRPLIC
mmetsp:Transcript_24137/g.69383  ORF Transcript_24137/g.69383 Transcript_24137/m.69383 type:complete len:212 (+) Transcript_24137:273-908(+)